MAARKTLVEAVEELEPQVTSSDPNERKLARRLRIERRWEALKKSKQSDKLESKSVHLDEQTDEIQIQLRKSAELLEKFLLEGEEYITNVRVANDSREVDRRENEGINKEKIFEQLDEEVQSASELFNNIANKWTVIQSHNDPLHINEAIMEQKEKCDMLISQKDAIIAMLNEELKNAERQFTKDQRKQIEDINTLSQRIEKQISFMRRAYREELGVLEMVIAKERETLIEVTDKKWEELFRKRENQEISNSNMKFEQVEEFNKRMKTLRIDFQEHFSETKIKLENDIEELQRELEKIKALALLNSEKLDYNYQILKKREDENIIIKSQQKRRMNKLQDVINDLRGQISDYETSMSNKIKKLSDNIKKLHKSILDIEAKADHFAHVNDEKFHMLWEMNKSRVLAVLKKILETDRVLYEQQMGLDWEPPQNFIVDKRTLPSYKVALINVPPEFIHEFHTSADNKTLNSRKLTITRSISSDREKFNNMEPEYKLSYDRVLKHILIKISDKSGFLAEKRLKALLKGYMDDQKDLVRLDNVFAALGIQGSTSIDILFKHFQPYTYCPVCHGSMILETSTRLDTKLGSAGSQVSTMFTRLGEATNLLIPELDEVIEAIRQPDNVLATIITDLVNVHDNTDEDTEASERSEHEGIDEICGAAVNDANLTDKSKDKSKAVASRKRVSMSVLQDSWACQFHHPLVISPVYVLKALKEFVASYYVRKVGSKKRTVIVGDIFDMPRRYSEGERTLILNLVRYFIKEKEAGKQLLQVSIPTTGARLERQRMTISRCLSEYDIKSYWEKFKQNFGQDRVRVWDALLEGLKKYHEILKDRRTICDEVLRLRKENSELKRLLANYLDHHEFLPAPCAKERN